MRMNDLYEIETPRQIEKTFIGTRVSTDEILNRPIEIHDFEIGLGKKSKNRLLYCQIRLNGEYRFYWTEAFKLINKLERTNRAKLPFITKIGWDSEQKYLIFKRVKR
ncbi:MAG: hypothetical protein PHE51_10070 [Eubacteriales bacterium]|nr:hypothetical protein [Eubacteriales bacterium]